MTFVVITYNKYDVLIQILINDNRCRHTDFYLICVVELIVIFINEIIKKKLNTMINNNDGVGFLK